jgi:hypothetical protein
LLRATRVHDRRFLKGLVAVVVAVIAASGCHNYPCRPVSFAEGDQFRITVLSPQPNGTSCHTTNLLALQPGESFTLIAGEYVDTPAFGCTRVGPPGAPPFGAGVLTSCAAGDGELGLFCTGASTGCSVFAKIMIFADIPPGSGTIEGGLLRVEWWQENACPIGSCLVDYDIQIDRVTP